MSKGVFIANRGEIAMRVASTCALFPLPGTQQPSAHAAFHALAVGSAGEANAAHMLAVPPPQRTLLNAAGVRAYLDVKALVGAATAAGAWGVHPGYGFLSESPAFAQAVQDAGMVWIGPDPAHLARFGEKTGARRLAAECGVPTLPGTAGDAASLEQVRAFAATLPRGAKVMIKAVAGGGGRGMRVVPVDDGETALARAYESCAREAGAAFGDDRLYAERYLENARHIEVQVIGDGTGDVAHLWERECSLQRKHQKLVEFAPAPSLTGGAASPLRQRLLASALRMASAGKYKSLGTFEFLCLPDSGEHFFMEANPRIQVEHTVTEQVTHLDLVALQLRIALGERLRDIGLGESAAPLPFPLLSAVQLRINSETLTEKGEALPAVGDVTAFSPPAGAGIRVDTAAHAPHAGIVYSASPAFDSLMAKVILTAPSFPAVLALGRRSLAAFALEGCESNLDFQAALLDHPDVAENRVHTAFVEQHWAELFAEAAKRKAKRTSGEKKASGKPVGKSSHQQAPPGTEALALPLSGIVSAISVKVGQEVGEGEQVAVIEALKMEHVVTASRAGRIEQICAKQGDAVQAASPLLFFAPLASSSRTAAAAKKELDLDHIPPKLQQFFDRQRLASPEAMASAVKRRHDAGFLTARENLALLADAGSVIEIGALAVAAQRTRIAEEKLVASTQGDGVLTAWATVNAELFERSSQRPGAESRARCALVLGDAQVLAGTQGYFHHLKLDRLFRSVLENPAPLIMYAEGGGGRPGDVDLAPLKAGGLEGPAFTLMALIRARGLPSIGVAAGYVFAGNAALLGTCDIVIASLGGVESAPKRLPTSIGMGGPAMIEGGGLGVYKPYDIGPPLVHAESGSVDIVVPTDRDAATLTKKLLGYFQGALPAEHWRHTSDQRRMRHVLPESRLRAYDVREVINLLADDETFCEIGEAWGKNLITGFLRVEGQPLGVVASSVASPLGGAIEAASARKATRFVQLLARTQCAHLVVLVDTPGFIVGGPETEGEGGLRAFPELFAAMSSLTDGGGRIFAITLRKAFGLGAQGLLGGGSLSNHSSVSWPNGEWGPMGVEGAVRLGFRKELEAAKSEEARQELFNKLVASSYERGAAVNTAAKMEIDAVIDPAATRHWVATALRMVRQRVPVWQQPEPSRPRL